MAPATTIPRPAATPNSAPAASVNTVLGRGDSDTSPYSPANAGDAHHPHPATSVRNCCRPGTPTHTAATIMKATSTSTATTRSTRAERAMLHHDPATCRANVAGHELGKRNGKEAVVQADHQEAADIGAGVR